MQAGEIGHMTVDIHGKQCSCGNRGCLVTLTYPAIDEVRRNNESDSIVDCAAIGIVNLMNLLDPELVVLGGRYRPRTSVCITGGNGSSRSHGIDPPRKNVRLVPSQLGDMGIALGLAGLVFDKFYWSRVFEDVG